MNNDKQRNDFVHIVHAGVLSTALHRDGGARKIIANLSHSSVVSSNVLDATNNVAKPVLSSSSDRSDICGGPFSDLTHKSDHVPSDSPELNDICDLTSSSGSCGGRLNAPDSHSLLLSDNRPTGTRRYEVESFRDAGPDSLTSQIDEFRDFFGLSSDKVVEDSDDDDFVSFFSNAVAENVDSSVSSKRSWPDAHPTYTNNDANYKGLSSVPREGELPCSLSFRTWHPSTVQSSVTNDDKSCKPAYPVNWEQRNDRWIKKENPASPPLELPPSPSLSPLPPPPSPSPVQDSPSEYSDFDVKRRRLLSTPSACGYYPHGRPPDGYADNVGHVT